MKLDAWNYAASPKWEILLFHFATLSNACSQVCTTLDFPVFTKTYHLYFSEIPEVQWDTFQVTPQI